MTEEELRADLGYILSAEETEQPNWNEVQDLCRRLVKRLEQQPMPDFPHDIWHFLADADIRRKDAQYGEEQRRVLHAWLDGAD